VVFIEKKYCYKIYSSDIMNFKSKKVLFVIGLPSSGKTNWTFHNLIDHVILDEFTTEKRIIPKGKFCIIDAALCDSNIFEEQFEKIKQKFSFKKIGFILFENDPIQCTRNSNERKPRFFGQTKESMKEEIHKYSKIYDLDFYKNLNIEFLELPVYKPSIIVQDKYIQILV
jgi:hypothetical protein